MDRPSQSAVSVPFSAQLQRFPLYRWWRLTVVETVDHQKVMDRIWDESGFAARYLFMTAMSAGIAVLGLLLSSPAVVIGAMLISPLMGPILGVGFGLALFDVAELRRAFTAFLVGSVAAVIFTALIVLASPLQATTTEILARTRPNLFDLLVALFAALAGTFAIIRGRGETIVGVAIATALMPPLAVVGYGLATWNLPVLSGSLALFGTNFLTIAMAATIMARLYGFGHHLSSKQTMMQTAVLLFAFVAMSVPLALALRQIAGEALFVRQLRSELSERLGPDSRITQLEVDFHQSPWAVRSVAIVPRAHVVAVSVLKDELQKELERRFSLEVDQIPVDPAAGAKAEQSALARANVEAIDGGNRADDVAKLTAVAAGVPLERVTLDRARQRAVVSAAPLPGADLVTYYALEKRVSNVAEGWSVEITPPAGQLPLIEFAEGQDQLEGSARQATLLSAWAARRWNVQSLAVPGWTESEPQTLSARRGRAIAEVLEAEGIRPSAAPAAGSSFRLSAAGGA